MKWLAAAVMLCACGSSGGGASDGAPGGDGGVDAAPPLVEPIHFIGRFDAQHRFAWPGTAVRATLHGTGAAIELEDGGNNWFEVTIDGAVQAPLHAMSGRHTYTLADGLPAADHDVLVARRTESFFGPTTFWGLSGGELVPTPRAAHLIEFIGDSITCGYGVLGVGPSCSFGADTEAETHAWGALAAQQLGAAHASIAYSGIGMSRNNGDNTDPAMPERYGLVIADDPTSAWDFSYAPDAVVIALGTNDFANGDPGNAFVDAYVQFEGQLRTHYPDAWIFFATSPMISDSFPAGAMQRTKLRDYLDQVAAIAHGDFVLDEKIGIVDIAEQLPADGYGCDYHPSAITAQKMADALVQQIQPMLGW